MLDAWYLVPRKYMIIMLGTPERRVDTPERTVWPRSPGWIN